MRILGAGLVRKKYEAAGVEWATTPEVRYCYDGQTYAGGACIGATVAGEAGRLTRYKQTIAGLAGTKEFGYTYFAGDAAAEKEYPSGRRVRTYPDELGREKWVSAAMQISDCLSGAAVPASQAYVTRVSYAAGGGIAQSTLGSGRVGATKYNERDQPVRMRLSTSSNAEALCGTTGDDWCMEKNRDVLIFSFFRHCERCQSALREL